MKGLNKMQQRNRWPKFIKLFFLSQEARELCCDRSHLSTHLPCTLHSIQPLLLGSSLLDQKQRSGGTVFYNQEQRLDNILLDQKKGQGTVSQKQSSVDSLLDQELTSANIPRYWTRNKNQGIVYQIRNPGEVTVGPRKIEKKHAG